MISAGIGPVTIKTMEKAMLGDFIGALEFYIGTLTVDIFYILLIIFGVSTFTQSITFRVVFGVFGILFLLYLGIGDIKDFFTKNLYFKKTTANKKSKNFIKTFFTGFMVNIANPMAAVAWIAFYSAASGDIQGNPWLFIPTQIGGLLLGFFVITIGFFLKKIMSEKVIRYVSLASGIALISFCVMFGFNLLVLLRN
ncbi:MAG: lysine exporter protein LysE/YggA [Candidatus Peregrinibacteria bacterium GW2011_GWC2_39_14]|nr:MAG: lysine exporter protein LysE/YggA [Candidatus Peregrinibacteria bacterium GW2011_GWC2_39_14]